MPLLLSYGCDNYICNHCGMHRYSGKHHQQHDPVRKADSLDRVQAQTTGGQP